MSAPRARRLIAAGVIATVLTAGSAGIAAATPPEGGDATVLADEPSGEPSAEPTESLAPEPSASPSPSPSVSPSEEPSEEEPAAVEVVAPTVRDATVNATLGKTSQVDLDAYVDLGTGEIVSIDLMLTPGGLGIDYDEASHVLTMSPTTAGKHSVEFQAEALTEGANGEDERSDIGVLTVVVADTTPKPPETPAVVAPVISWAQTPEATTTSTSAHFAVNVDAGDDKVEYLLDLPPEAQSASPTEISGNSFDVTGLSVGRHWIRVVVSRGEAWSALDYEWVVVAAPAAAPVLSADAIPAAVVRAGISRGASGESVAIIQRVVGTSADGRFGAATRAAVIAFQRAHGLVADGIVGPLTWAAIVDVANGGTGVVPVTATSIPAAQVARGISRGASGSSVAVIQRIVGAGTDGRFGPRTQAAVRAWQKAHGLVADGIVGRLTWAAMVAR
jgi:peptidoglycan hydrolase-like protein with peptidoglycan-binding domain